jgi:hypothetical protein
MPIPCEAITDEIAAKIASGATYITYPVTFSMI